MGEGNIETCPKCNGTRSYKMLECSRCNGTGWVDRFTGSAFVHEYGREKRIMDETKRASQYWAEAGDPELKKLWSWKVGPSGKWVHVREGKSDFSGDPVP